MRQRNKHRAKNGWTYTGNNNGNRKESKRPTDQDCKKPRGFKKPQSANNIRKEHKKNLTPEEKQRLSAAKMFSKTFHPEKLANETDPCSLTQ